jgi:spore maturation protein CgeB
LKITLFGLTISSSWGNGHATPYRALLRALARRGHDISFYEKDVEYYYWRRDLASCDYCNLVLYPDWEQVRWRALSEAAASDVVVVGSYCPEGSRICDELLALPNPLHVFYDLDTPITLNQLEAGDLEYLRRDQMPGFDLYLSFTGGEILRELRERWGVREARALYGCVDPDVHARVPLRKDLHCDLSYMGTYAADRQQKLQELFLLPAQMLGTGSFVLAGTMYAKDWPWPSNLKRFDHLPPKDHPALYSSSRATLNITREGMARGGYCPSGRFFEAAACGTPIISDWFKGLDSFFSQGNEILVVGSAAEVVAALQSSDEELERIGARAGERTLAEHTGDARAQELLRYVDEARSRGSRPATDGGHQHPSHMGSVEVAS